MIVLIAFPDHERTLTEKAFEELGISNRCRFFDTLSEARGHCDPGFPRVVIFNIDAPGHPWKADLSELKKTDLWKAIPAIGYGFLQDETDIAQFYSHGGASCIRKSTSYDELLDSTRTTMGYWLSMSILPCEYLGEA